MFEREKIGIQIPALSKFENLSDEEQISLQTAIYKIKISQMRNLKSDIISMISKLLSIGSFHNMKDSLANLIILKDVEPEKLSAIFRVRLDLSEKDTQLNDAITKFGIRDDKTNQTLYSLIYHLRHRYFLNKPFKAKQHVKAFPIPIAQCLLDEVKDRSHISKYLLKPDTASVTEKEFSVLKKVYPDNIIQKKIFRREIHLDIRLTLSEIQGLFLDIANKIQTQKVLAGAAEYNSIPLTDTFLENYNLYTQEPVWSLAAKNDVTSLQDLVEKNKSIDIQNLHTGITLLAHAVKLQSPSLVKFCLEKGSNLNLADITGYSPLHYAVEGSSEEIVDLLLNAGANPNAEDQGKFSTLYVAAELGKATFVGKLLDKGANPNIANNRYCSTPLHIATHNCYKDTIKVLLDSGKVNIDLKNEKGHKAQNLVTDKQPEISKLFMEYKNPPAQPSGLSAPLPAQPSGLGAPLPAQPSGLGAPLPAQPSGLGASLPAQPSGFGATLPIQPSGLSAHLIVTINRKAFSQLSPAQQAAVNKEISELRAKHMGKKITFDVAKVTAQDICKQYNILGSSFKSSSHDQVGNTFNASQSQLPVGRPPVRNNSLPPTRLPSLGQGGNTNNLNPPQNISIGGHPHGGGVLRSDQLDNVRRIPERSQLLNTLPPGVRPTQNQAGPFRPQMNSPVSSGGLSPIPGRAAIPPSMPSRSAPITPIQNPAQTIIPPQPAARITNERLEELLKNAKDNKNQLDQLCKDYRESPNPFPTSVFQPCSQAEGAIHDIFSNVVIKQEKGLADARSDFHLLMCELKNLNEKKLLNAGQVYCKIYALVKQAASAGFSLKAVMFELYRYGYLNHLIRLQEGKTPLQVAIDSEDGACIKEIFAAQPDHSYPIKFKENSMTELEYAILTGKLVAVKTMCELAANREVNLGDVPEDAIKLTEERIKEISETNPAFLEAADYYDIDVLLASKNNILRVLQHLMDKNSLESILLPGLTFKDVVNGMFSPSEYKVFRTLIGEVELNNKKPMLYWLMTKFRAIKILSSRAEKIQDQLALETDPKLIEELQKESALIEEALKNRTDRNFTIHREQRATYGFTENDPRTTNEFKHATNNYDAIKKGGKLLTVADVLKGGVRVSSTPPGAQKNIFFSQNSPLASITPFREQSKHVIRIKIAEAVKKPKNGLAGLLSQEDIYTTPHIPAFKIENVERPIAFIGEDPTKKTIYRVYHYLEKGKYYKMHWFDYIDNGELIGNFHESLSMEQAYVEYKRDIHHIAFATAFTITDQLLNHGSTDEHDPRHIRHIVSVDNFGVLSQPWINKTKVDLSEIQKYLLRYDNIAIAIIKGHVEAAAAFYPYLKDSKFSKLYPPIHLALKYGQDKVIKRLLELGVSRDENNALGENTLQVAKLYDAKPDVIALIEGKIPGVEEFLSLAIKNRNLADVKKHLQEMSIEQLTGRNNELSKNPLILAVTEGNLEIVTAVIKLLEDKHRKETTATKNRYKNWLTESIMASMELSEPEIYSYLICYCMRYSTVFITKKTLLLNSILVKGNLQHLQIFFKCFAEKNKFKLLSTIKDASNNKPETYLDVAIATGDVEKIKIIREKIPGLDTNRVSREKPVSTYKMTNELLQAQAPTDSEEITQDRQKRQKTANNLAKTNDIPSEVPPTLVGKEVANATGVKRARFSFEQNDTDSNGQAHQGSNAVHSFPKAVATYAVPGTMFQQRELTATQGQQKRQKIGDKLDENDAMDLDKPTFTG